MTSSEKIVSLGRLKSIFEERGERVRKRLVLANGCFDIIHVGHIRYLREASGLGDILIVAVHDDGSVRRLKGPPRPLLPVEGRTRIVAAFSFVDYVLPFPGDTVEPVIRAVKPDVHCLGADDRKENLAERRAVLSYGGEVIVTGAPEDRSPRDIVKLVTARFGGK